MRITQWFCFYHRITRVLDVFLQFNFRILTYAHTNFKWHMPRTHCIFCYSHLPCIMQGWGCWEIIQGENESRWVVYYALLTLRQKSYYHIKYMNTFFFIGIIMFIRKGNWFFLHPLSRTLIGHHLSRDLGGNHLEIVFKIG